MTLEPNERLKTIIIEARGRLDYTLERFDRGEIEFPEVSRLAKANLWQMADEYADLVIDECVVKPLIDGLRSGKFG